MTLTELSKSYRISAELLRGRIVTLKEQKEGISDQKEAIFMTRRIAMLSAMWRESRDIAVLLEHYYERGYRRNARYTI